jgi:hypothetical protein
MLSVWLETWLAGKLAAVVRLPTAGVPLRAQQGLPSGCLLDRLGRRAKVAKKSI